MAPALPLDPSGIKKRQYAQRHWEMILPALANMRANHATASVLWAFPESADRFRLVADPRLGPDHGARRSGAEHGCWTRVLDTRIQQPFPARRGHGTRTAPEGRARC